MPTASLGNILDLPIGLRTQDIRYSVLSADSRFREAAATSTASDFYWHLTERMKNVIRLRIATAEVPTNYPFFNSNRDNTSIAIQYGANYSTAMTLTISGGNYTQDELATELSGVITDAGLSWLSIGYNSNTNHFTFTGTQSFVLDTASNSIDRQFDYGLGYYLGFARGVWKSPTSNVLESTQGAQDGADPYLLLALDGFGTIYHPMNIDTLTATSKICIHSDNLSHTRYFTHHSSEVMLSQPTDIVRFRVRLLDAYGNTIPLGGANISFSVEATVVLNSSLYEALRNGQTTKYLS